MRQVWEVKITFAGGGATTQETVGPGVMLQASAEVQAIKAAMARGEKDVRCVFSRFIREEVG